MIVADVDAAIVRVTEGLRTVLKKKPHVRLALENMVHVSRNKGSGCEDRSHWSLKQIKRVIDEVGNPRIMACVDICHAYIRDYDLRHDQGVTAMLRDMEAIGWNNIAGLHVSDSVTPHGGRCEGHEV